MSGTAESALVIVAGAVLFTFGRLSLRTAVWERFGRLTRRVNGSKFLDEDDASALFRFVGRCLPLLGAAWVAVGLVMLVASW